MPGSITPLPVMLEELPEEDRAIYEKLEVPKTLVVRYGYQRLIAELPYDGDRTPGCSTKLVIRTNRGIELGELVTTTCPNSGCGSSISRKEMLQYIERSGGKDYPFNTQGKILRIATMEDLNEQTHLDAGKPEIIQNARQKIRQLDLKMKLVEIERLLGGERILFYYTAEDWIDFRELVKQLASDYQTRIEMCQVNAREEARLVADYERCGQQCCCKQFLKVLKPVSMRSAKVQKATLDPTKISGRCGRLMCCLRYEDQTYEELRKRLPHRKTRVLSEDGPGIVIGGQILTQLVMVSLDNGKTQAYPLEELELNYKGEAPPQETPPTFIPKPKTKPHSAHREAPIRQNDPPATSGYSNRIMQDAPPREPAQQDDTNTPADTAGDTSSYAGTNDTGGQQPQDDSATGQEDGPRKRRRRRSRGKRRGGGDGASGNEGGNGGQGLASSGEGSTPPVGEGGGKKKRRRRRRKRGGGGNESGGESPQP